MHFKFILLIIKIIDFCTYLFGFLKLKMRFLRLFKEILIFNYVSSDATYPLKSYSSKVDPVSSLNIVWTAWFQGLDSAPELVKICIDSFKKIEGYKTIVIDKSNYSNYVSLPPIIVDKFNSGIIGYTAFSEIIRLELLSSHGGIWLDSTVYLPRVISNPLNNRRFFTLKGIENLPPGEVMGLTPVFCLGSKAAYQPLVKVRDLIFNYWEKNDRQLDYLLVDYCFKFIYKTDEIFKKDVNGLEVNGKGRFLLMQNFNSKFSEDLIHLLKNGPDTILKLSNRSNLKTHDSFGNLTVFGYFIKNGGF